MKINTQSLALSLFVICIAGCASQSQVPVNNPATEETPAPVCTASCADNESCVNGQCRENPSIQCAPLPKSDKGRCYREGEGQKLIVRGDILGIQHIYEGGSVVIENGRISYVGCDPDLSNAVVITCADSVISPSFINGHEHLTYSNNAPATWEKERFAHRNEWRKGLNGHTKVKGPTTKYNEVVEIRALLSGTTSIFGNGKIDGLARNIDSETVDGIQSVYQTFPLGDVDGISKESGCDYNYHEAVLESDDGKPFGPHVGEGINQSALNEMICLSGQGTHDIMRENLALLHGVASTPDIIARMAQNDVKLMWSPRSNIALYGDTAMVPMYDRFNIIIGLGTDWIYSGSATMLRELQCADHINQNYYNHYFSDYQLWRMPTYNNAIAFGLGHQLGAIQKDYIADITVFSKKQGQSTYRAVIDAQNKDIQLVIMNGKPVFGDANLLESGESFDMCGTSKKVDLAATGYKGTFADAVSHAAYPMFFCDIPEHEPSCTPERTREEDTQALHSSQYEGMTQPVDSDGDGIPDQEDNCPAWFNPIRPMDQGKQADFDGDTIGDICDPNPLCAADAQSCPELVYDDYDADGIPNENDNCPRAANPDQSDRDQDGKGDACDACPEAANPGDARCAIETITTIQQANQMIWTQCPQIKPACKIQEEIKVKGRVTAITAHGFFIQMPDAAMPEGSAIYIADTAPVHINDDVTVQGYPARYSGLPKLVRAAVTINSHNNPPIDPVRVNAADITTGGPLAEKYTGVYIEIASSKVLPHDNQAAYGMYPIIDPSQGTIYLDDFIWRIDPIPNAGKEYPHVRGILVYDFDNFKIAPRNNEDL
ncbi:MAG: amidohydrolase family protein [Proteobacteria bacterium]|nr:amidohydrolase family protein [Pseudomonadota bacterium]